MTEIIAKINGCKTMTQLNNIRDDVFDAMVKCETSAECKDIQLAFRRRKKWIKRHQFGRMIDWEDDDYNEQD